MAEEKRLEETSSKSRQLEAELEMAYEEIYGVKKDFQKKLSELIQVNSGFDSLLHYAKIGVIFVDKDMKIRKITSVIGKNSELKLADTGRSVSEVRFMKSYPSLEADIKQCRESESIIEREIFQDDKNWLLRFCPFDLAKDGAEGALVILIDITQPMEEAKFELQVINNSIPGGVTQMRYDNGLVVEYGNDTIFKMMRMTREEVRQRYQNHYERIMYKEEWEELRKRIEEGIHHNKMIRMEYRVSVAEYTDEWRLMQARVLKEVKGKPLLQCIIIDITEQKRMQHRLNALMSASQTAYAQLQEEREKLNVVLEMSGDMIFEYDIQRDSMSYNKAGEGILYPEQVTERYSERAYQSGLFEEEAAGVELCQKFRSGQENIQMELKRIGSDGKFHWVEVTARTICGKEGKPEKVIGKIQNIDEQKEREARLKEKSQKDSLTGLLNHKTAKKRIIERIMQSEGKEAYLIVCDIDNFKQINDVNGHLFGDSVLCSFADEMASVFSDEIKGRIGGDEFILYVEHMERTRLEEKLQELNRYMTDHFTDGDEPGTGISCSFGGVVVDGTYRDYAELFRWADSALYQVKSSEKGSVVIIQAGAENEVPGMRYFGDRKNADDYIREEALIKNEEELIFFCIELLEHVADIGSALKMISDRTCRFFDFDDMVCVENISDEKNAIYQWNRRQKCEYTQRMDNKDVYDYDRFYKNSDEHGVLLYTEADTRNIETEEAKSVMIVVSKEVKDHCGSMVYADRRHDRDWKAEKETLTRIANLIFHRMRQLRLEKEERQKLDLKINYDRLTGLPQYQKFIQLAEEYMQKNGHKGLFCIYSDFSNFQYLNKLYGYTVGDEVLREYARALMKECEGSVLFSRVISDHFVGMIKAENLEAAEASFQDFSARYADKVYQKYKLSNLVVASGIYEVTGEENSVAGMLDYANAARKKCKEQKIVTDVAVYNDKIRMESENNKAIEASMGSALNNGEFHAYLQPKVSLATGKIVGAEALVRWIRQDGTRLMPNQFIDIFEQNGFIIKVDFAILEQVMGYLQRALGEGEEVVPISVNFSRRHNEFAQFVPSIQKRLEKYSVPPELIEAEITESMFLGDLSNLKINIENLRKMGILIDMDDFGSGYSSLNVLTKVNADIIKLDRQFLNYGRDDRKAAEVLKCVIQMLKHLGYQVIAEGVETKEQLEMLKQSDCDMVQGYYYAKPMPIEEFRIFLQQFNHTNRRSL